MNRCLICSKTSTENSVLLTNGNSIHKHCEQELFKQIVNLEAQIKNPELKELFHIENELKSLKTKQEEIYDFWSTYPPDWSKRKERIKLERNTCDRCKKKKFKKKDGLEVHHKISLHNGGSHKKENLELLCKTCHKLEHERNPHRFRRKKFIKN